MTVISAVSILSGIYSACVNVAVRTFISLALVFLLATAFAAQWFLTLFVFPTDFGVLIIMTNVN